MSVPHLLFERREDRGHVRHVLPERHVLDVVQRRAPERLQPRGGTAFDSIRGGIG